MACIWTSRGKPDFPSPLVYGAVAQLQLTDKSTTKPARLHYARSRVCVNHRRAFVAAELEVRYKGLHARNFLPIRDN